MSLKSIFHYVSDKASFHRFCYSAAHRFSFCECEVNKYQNLLRLIVVVTLSVDASVVAQTAEQCGFTLSNEVKYTVLHCSLLIFFVMYHIKCMMNKSIICITIIDDTHHEAHRLLSAKCTYR